MVDRQTCLFEDDVLEDERAYAPLLEAINDAMAA